MLLDLVAAEGRPDRQADLGGAVQRAALHAPFDAGRFPPAPPACYPAPWRLPGPDLHWQADASLCSDQIT